MIFAFLSPLMWSSFVTVGTVPDGTGAEFVPGSLVPTVFVFTTEPRPLTEQEPLSIQVPRTTKPRVPSPKMAVPTPIQKAVLASRTSNKETFFVECECSSIN